MDIRSGLDGLKSLLGVAPLAPQVTKPDKSQAVEGGSLGSDRATLSSAGSEVAQTASEGGARGDKVAEIQAALASGTYDIPASSVASKVVDAMLVRGE
jgi:negative regulator of flagellin synthesis FlgM